MTVLRLLLLISLLALTASAQQPFSPPASCPVTGPPERRFIPPSPFESDEGEKSFLLGTEKL